MDTMEYDDIRTYIFRPDLSNGLTGNEIVTTIHPGKSVNDEEKKHIKSILFTYLWTQLKQPV